MRLRVRVTPNAAVSEVIGWDGELLKLRIAAPAIEEKVNREIIRFLAHKLRLAPSLFTFIREIFGRDKILEMPVAIELLKGKLGQE